MTIVYLTVSEHHTHPHPPHVHTPHSHVHSGSSVSATLPQRGLQLLRRNRGLQTWLVVNKKTLQEKTGKRCNYFLSCLNRENKVAEPTSLIVFSRTGPGTRTITHPFLYWSSILGISFRVDTTTETVSSSTHESWHETKGGQMYLWDDSSSKIDVTWGMSGDQVRKTGQDFDQSTNGLTGPVLPNELPESHCTLSFLVSLTIVYCRIKKLTTDNSSETLTKGLWNLDPGNSTVMNNHGYGRTYRNGILVTKFRVRYVKITSTKRNTGSPPFDPHDRL